MERSLFFDAFEYNLGIEEERDSKARNIPPLLHLPELSKQLKQKQKINCQNQTKER